MRRATILSSAALYSAVLAAFVSPVRGDEAAEVRKLTGRPTRLVWSQAVDKQNDFCAQGNRFRLLGLDTEDGKGIRPIRGEIAGYAKPLLTADGSQIVYSSRPDNTVYVVKWNGGGRRKLASGFASDVWADPATGIEWVLVRTGNGDQNNAIVRYRLDKPGAPENVWDKTANGHNLVPWFRLSADGKRAADAFPWGNCGVANLTAGNWKQYSGGCWPSIAPDNSYRMFVFQGNHREVAMFDRDGQHRRIVKINQASGINGRDVYFPRWASDARFLTMTGPGVGGREAELYLGRFDEGFNSVARWVRVTHNKTGDFFGDAWIKPSKAPSASVAARPANEAPAIAQKKTGNGDGLVFVWEDGSKMNEIVDPVSRQTKSCRAQARGHARHGLHYAMDLTGGAFVAEDCDAGILAACRASNQLTLEALITPAKARQSGPARIISFSSNSGSRNFTLGQENDKLILRLRTPQTGENGVKPEIELCRLAADRPQHVIVSYSPGKLTCYRDGRQVLATDKVRGDFSNWSAQHLLFGDEWDGGRDWQGLLEGIAVYSRAMGADEARRRHASAMRRLKGRRPLERVVLQATLTETSPTPPPNLISPYRRVLVVNAYKIDKVIKGRCDSAKILVAEWGILDRKVRPSGRRIGKRCQLALEKFDEHAELEPEKLIMETDEFELPLYYEVRSSK